jgi:hypothetical protein
MQYHHGLDGYPPAPSDVRKNLFRQARPWAPPATGKSSAPALFTFTVSSSVMREVAPPGERPAIQLTSSPS